MASTCNYGCTYPHFMEPRPHQFTPFRSTIGSTALPPAHPDLRHRSTSSRRFPTTLPRGAGPRVAAGPSTMQRVSPGQPAGSRRATNRLLCRLSHLDGCRQPRDSWRTAPRRPGSTESELAGINFRAACGSRAAWLEALAAPERFGAAPRACGRGCPAGEGSCDSALVSGWSSG